MGRIMHHMSEKANKRVRAYREEKRKAKDPLARWIESVDQIEVKVEWNDEKDVRPLG